MAVYPIHQKERMDRRKDMAIEVVLEQVIERGPGEVEFAKRHYTPLWPQGMTPKVPVK